MGHKRLRPSFETPRKRAAPQDDGGVCGRMVENGDVKSPRRGRDLVVEHAVIDLDVID
jgi:hypothetical protein